MPPASRPAPGRGRREDRALDAEGGVIDFRVRPPFRSFRSAFHPDREIEQSDDELMEAFNAEMDAAGIRRDNAARLLGLD